MRITLGLDLGSGSVKAVVLRDDGRVLGRAIRRARADFEGLARDARQEALDAAGLRVGDVAYTATTGLGRYSVSFRDVQMTDVTAVAKGAWYLARDATCVLDMGAQSTRAIRLGEGGKVREFHTNEKCAAGSGAFLVRAARYLEIPLESLGEISIESQSPRMISSVCAVLAESEIINHVSDGVAVKDIVRGVHESLADRALTQLRKVRMDGPLALVGGVALQRGMIEACRRKLGVPVIVPDEPQYVTALGAAVLALQRAAKRAAEMQSAP